eukprot:TRINITY_DN17095_c0_g1_i1.p1 TRINITY_DN17095_c0_g1~~TRINITY_DN17095_c0_g1_i1.p1  ORF type:complete len:207 (+),score=29.26 TRINITY_DN17095_c0_g1_i1:39-623(+)
MKLDRRSIGGILGLAGCGIACWQCSKKYRPNTLITPTAGTRLVQYRNDEYGFSIKHLEGFEVVVSRHTGCVLFEIVKEGAEPITIVMEELESPIPLQEYSECAAKKTLEELQTIENACVKEVPCSSTINFTSPHDFAQWQLEQNSNDGSNIVDTWNGICMHNGNAWGIQVSAFREGFNEAMDHAMIIASSLMFS